MTGTTGPEDRNAPGQDARPYMAYPPQTQSAAGTMMTTRTAKKKMRSFLDAVKRRAPSP